MFHEKKMEAIRSDYRQVSWQFLGQVLKGWDEKQSSSTKKVE